MSGRKAWWEVTIITVLVAGIGTWLLGGPSINRWVLAILCVGIMTGAFAVGRKPMIWLAQVLVYPLIPDAEEGFTGHFRDPQISRDEHGWRMLIPRCSAWVISARLASGYRNLAWVMALAMLRYQKTSSSPQSKKLTHNANNATLPRPLPRLNSDTRMQAWLKSPRQNNAVSTSAS